MYGDLECFVTSQWSEELEQQSQFLERKWGEGNEGNQTIKSIQGSSGGVKVGVFASHQCGPGVIAPQGPYVGWVGSCLAPKVFLHVLQFSNLPPQISTLAWKPAKADISSSLSIVIYFFIISFSIYPAYFKPTLDCHYFCP